MGALAALLVCAAPAAAAPIVLGDGNAPAVAVDQQGTAYISWIGAEPTTTSLHFCRLPRNAAACDRSGVIATQGTSISRPFVEVDGATVRVLSYRYGLTGPRFDQDFLFTSSDGGTSFGAGLPVGITPFYDAISGPGAGISLVTSAVTQGEFFQRVPTDGGSAGTEQALFSTTNLYLGTASLDGSGNPVVVYADASGNAFLRRYSGTGNINDAASWSPETPIGLADWPHLAGGPAGTYLLATDGQRRLFVRQLGSAFGPARPIPGATGESAQDYMTQDAGGRLHVLLPQITANGSRLLYANSDDAVAWTQRSLAFEPLAQQVRASFAPDHRGVAVWQGTPSGGGPTVYAMAVDGSSLPAPQLGKSVNVSATSGRVRVAVRGRSSGRGARASQKGLRFVPLTQPRQIPTGSYLDTSRGTVRLTSATGTRSKTQSGKFSTGIFQVLQSRKKRDKGLTELRLKGSSFKRCRSRGASAAGLSRRTIRRLKANAKGRFRTRGRNSAATVRGTIWLTADRCDGTLTTVKRGRVAVRDFRRKRTVIVRAGKRYLAR